MYKQHFFLKKYLLTQNQNEHILFPITDAARQCAPFPLFCYRDDNDSDTKIGKIFKERCLSLTITLSLSTWYHFKAHDLFFLIVLSECKSKLYFCVKYSLPNSTDSADYCSSVDFNRRTFVLPSPRHTWHLPSLTKYEYV